MKKTRLSFITRRLRLKELLILQELLKIMLLNETTEICWSAKDLEERGITKKELLDISSCSLEVESKSDFSEIEERIYFISGLRVTANKYYEIELSEGLIKEPLNKEWIKHFIAQSIDEAPGNKPLEFSIERVEEEDPEALEKFEKMRDEANKNTEQMINSYKNRNN